MSKDELYQALISHDRRFDGVFFTCVSTTKIYCRPTCPTKAPKINNCDFVFSQAHAEILGFRPCLRCRPELAPKDRSTENNSAQILAKQIQETLLIDKSLEETSESIGQSTRHIRREFTKQFGMEPKQYLTTQRLLFAKHLLHNTNLPIDQIAYSSGFGSPTRLVSNMKKNYEITPSKFRKMNKNHDQSILTLRVDYRPPLDWQSLLETLAGRSTPNEWIDGNKYYRKVDDHVVCVSNQENSSQLIVKMPTELSKKSYDIIQRVRKLFDTDSNPKIIYDHFKNDPYLGETIKQYPGIRVPGAWDSFELLIRVIVGQQVSVKGATTIMGRICDNIGSSAEAISKSFPDIIAGCGMPSKRAFAIWNIATAVYNNKIDLDELDPLKFYQQLIAMPGIGPWTGEYVTMRVLHWPDSFPVNDLGVIIAVRKLANLPELSLRETEKRILEISKSWKPWRSYATMLLWKYLQTDTNNQGG